MRDAARYIDTIAGPTAIDPTSLPRPTRSYEDAVVSGDAAARLRGKRATWSSTLGFAVCDPEVEKLSHEAALALTFVAYNFVTVHGTLKTTPAVAHGLTDHPWTMEELLGELANH